MKIFNQTTPVLALAPMEDVTDAGFRRFVRQLGADVVYTEFASSEALVRDARKTFDKIKVFPDERPVGIQIFGSTEVVMEKAAFLAEKEGPDFIDINCGCWVKKVSCKGAGAGLLKDIKAFRSVVLSVMKGTSLPVTVKTRLGWDKRSIIIVEVAKMLEDIGVRALTVHCRTRDQGHEGDVDRKWLAKIREAVNIPLLGNGDIASVEDVKELMELGCDGVMIGRAAIKKPWIFHQLKSYFEKGILKQDPGLAEKIKYCRTHLNLTLQSKDSLVVLREFRKFYASYLSGFKQASSWRQELMQQKDITGVFGVLDRLEQESLQESWIASV